MEKFPGVIMYREKIAEEFNFHLGSKVEQPPRTTHTHTHTESERNEKENNVHKAHLLLKEGRWWANEGETLHMRAHGS